MELEVVYISKYSGKSRFAFDNTGNERFRWHARRHPGHDYYRGNNNNNPGVVVPRPSVK